MDFEVRAPGAFGRMRGILKTMDSVVLLICSFLQCINSVNFIKLCLQLL